LFALQDDLSDVHPLKETIDRPHFILVVAADENGTSLNLLIILQTMEKKCSCCSTRSKHHSTFPNDEYKIGNGTSMEASHVSRVAALIKAANQGLSSSRDKKCHYGNCKAVTRVV